MGKHLVVNGYLANGGVEEVEDGADVVLRIPFCDRDTAEVALGELCKEGGVVSERVTEDN